jgi:hypothetical protein
MLKTITFILITSLTQFGQATDGTNDGDSTIIISSPNSKENDAKPGALVLKDRTITLYEDEESLCEDNYDATYPQGPIHFIIPSVPPKIDPTSYYVTSNDDLLSLFALRPQASSVRIDGNSQTNGNTIVSLRYLFQGLTWKPFYTLQFNDKKTRLEGWMTINNQTGIAFDKTKILLSFKQGKGSPRPLFNHVISLLQNSQNFMWFNEKEVAYHSYYRLNVGGNLLKSNEDDLNPTIEEWISLDEKEPLFQGDITIYKDKQLVGESFLNDRKKFKIPQLVNRKDAPLIHLERRLSRQLNEKKKEEGYVLTIHNPSKQKILIKVIFEIPSDFTVTFLKETESFKQKGNMIFWDLTVEPGQERELKYFPKIEMN